MVLAQDDPWTDEESLNRLLRQAEQREQDLLRKLVFIQEEIDWLVYELFGLTEAAPSEGDWQIAPDERPFAWRGTAPPCTLPAALRDAYFARRRLLDQVPPLQLIETPTMKRLWRGTSGESGRYGETYRERFTRAARAWLAARLETLIEERGKASSAAVLVASVQDDARVLAVAAVLQQRRDVDLSGLLLGILETEAVPSHRFHTYTDTGLAKRAVWEEVWALQHREDAGKKAGEIPIAPDYSQGSRGKATDFVRTDYWRLRGRLDVPKERFIAFTEVPGRSGVETLYGWAGWTAQQRVKAVLAIDEELEDASVPLADRIGLLDSAWRLLPGVAREDAAAANRLKAELQALVGPEGPSRALIEDWKKRFPAPSARGAARAKPAKASKRRGKRTAATTDEADDVNSETNNA